MLAGSIELRKGFLRMGYLNVVKPVHAACVGWKRCLIAGAGLKNSITKRNKNNR